MFGPTPDRYDDIRREWIDDHQGIFTMQKRRAQLLNRQIRRRNRRASVAVPNPNDDRVIHPLLFRKPTTPEAVAETVLVGLAAALAPLGWPLGRLLYLHITAFIPDRLRAFPIKAALWTAIGVGTLTTLLYTPQPSVTATVLAPYLLAQIPAVFLTAGIYALLNGWIAVDGSSNWWPLTPKPLPVDLHLPIGPDDLTAPPVFLTGELPDHQSRRPPTTSDPNKTSTAPIIIALILAAAGTAWITTAVIAGVIDRPHTATPTTYISPTLRP